MSNTRAEKRRTKKIEKKLAKKAGADVQVTTVPLTNLESESASPIIKIADDKETKKYNQAFQMALKPFIALEWEEGVGPDGKPWKREKSYRHQDIFIGGPPGLDGHVCDHQPNGPKSERDPKGNWADYYIFDNYATDPTQKHVRTKGYHMYSTVRGVMSEDNPGSMWDNKSTVGTRGPNQRKQYFYHGFYPEEALYVIWGVSPHMFSYHLSI